MNKFQVFCIILIHVIVVVNAGSILGWLTGGNKTPTTTTLPPLITAPIIIGNVPGRIPVPVPEFQEETGECSHWGEVPLGLPTSASSSIPTAFDPDSGDSYSRDITLSTTDLIGSHKTLPVGTMVSVTNILTGKTATIRVVPPRTLPVYGRVMVLSPNAFSQLANLRKGIFPCSVNVVQGPKTQTNLLTSHTFDSGLRPQSQFYDVPRLPSILPAVPQRPFAPQPPSVPQRPFILGGGSKVTSYDPEGDMGRTEEKNSDGGSSVIFYDPEGNMESFTQQQADTSPDTPF